MTNYNESDVPGGGGSSIGSGDVINLPPTGNAGDVFFPANSIIMYVHNGVEYVGYGQIAKLTPPVNGDWSWINQGGATVDVSKGGIILKAPASAAINYRIRKKAAPATPYTIRALIKPVIKKANYAFIALGWRHAADGKLAFMRVGSDSLTVNGLSMDTVIAANGPASIETGDYSAAFNQASFEDIWMQIADDGVNRSMAWSRDGQIWITLHSIARTDTIGTPDEIFWGVDSRNSVDAYGWMLSYQELAS